MSARDLMLSKVARVLSDRQAAACNVDCGDMWKLHGDDFFADAYAVLDEVAALGLLEALDNLIEAADSMKGTYGRIWGKTPEDEDLFTHDQWAQDFLSERADEARAAIAKATQ